MQRETVSENENQFCQNLIHVVISKGNPFQEELLWALKLIISTYPSQDIVRKPFVKKTLEELNYIEINMNPFHARGWGT